MVLFAAVGYIHHLSSWSLCIKRLFSLDGRNIIAPEIGSGEKLLKRSAKRSRIVSGIDILRGSFPVSLFVAVFVAEAVASIVSFIIRFRYTLIGICVALFVCT